jgi:hypothetical protein
VCGLFVEANREGFDDRNQRKSKRGEVYCAVVSSR